MKSQRDLDGSRTVYPISRTSIDRMGRSFFPTLIPESCQEVSRIFSLRLVTLGRCRFLNLMEAALGRLIRHRPMDASNEHVLIVRPVEEADLSLARNLHDELATESREPVRGGTVP